MILVTFLTNKENLSIITVNPRKLLYIEETQKGNTVLHLESKSVIVEEDFQDVKAKLERVL